MAEGYTTVEVDDGEGRRQSGRRRGWSMRRRRSRRRRSRRQLRREERRDGTSVKGARNDAVTCGRLFDATLPHPAHSVVSKNYSELMSMSAQA